VPLPGEFFHSFSGCRDALGQLQNRQTQYRSGIASPSNLHTVMNLVFNY
jgi:hypothetical protein